MNMYRILLKKNNNKNSLSVSFIVIILVNCILHGDKEEVRLGQLERSEWSRGRSQMFGAVYVGKTKHEKHEKKIQPQKYQMRAMLANRFWISVSSTTAHQVPSNFFLCFYILNAVAIFRLWRVPLKYELFVSFSRLLLHENIALVLSQLRLARRGCSCPMLTNARMFHKHVLYTFYCFMLCCVH